MSTPNDYLDRFNRKTKPWKQLLFNAGRAVQASELNELQTVLQSEIGQLGGSLFKEGSILSGCEVVIDIDNLIASMDSGQIYALGAVHDIPADTISITGTGEEVLGVLMAPTVITEAIDPDLVGQAPGSESQGEAGADRLVYSYQLVIDDQTATPIAVLSEGAIIQVFGRGDPVLDQVNSSLARRTNEESGSYTVTKYDGFVEDLVPSDPDFDTHLLLVTREGIAYVEGWRQDTGTVALRFPRPLETANRIDEPETFVGGTLQYTVDNPKIFAITGMTATIESPEFSVVRGVVGGGSDTVAAQYQPIVQIVQVTSAAGGGGTVYVAGTDFIQTGNNIDWSPGGAEPSAGSTYYAVVSHIYQMIKGTRTMTDVPAEAVVRGAGVDSLANDHLHSVTSIVRSGTTYIMGTDFTVDVYTGGITWIGSEPGFGLSYDVHYTYWATNVQGDYLGRDSFFKTDAVTIAFDDYPNYLESDGAAVDYLTQISFDTGGTGQLPVSGSLFYQDYAYTLPRRDVVVLDTAGRLGILSGISSIHPIPPVVGPGQMPIFTLAMPAEARVADVVIEVHDNQRLTMGQLRDLVGQMHDMLYNQAISSLSTEANDTALPTEKRGIMADNFRGFEFCDVGHVDFGACIDPLERVATLSQGSESSALLSATAGWVEDYRMRDFVEVLVATQPFATGLLQVNPHTIVNLRALATLIPAFDRWVETEHTVVRHPDRIINLPPRFIRNRSSVSRVNLIRGNPQQRRLMRWGLNPRWLGNGSTRCRTGGRLACSTTQTVSTLEVTAREVVNRSADIESSLTTEEIPFARQIVVAITGTDFVPDEDNISVTFDGRPVGVTPTGASVAGANANTILADALGGFTAEITVPEATKAGAHEIMIIGTGSASQPVGSRTVAEFRSRGIQEHILHEVTVTRQERNVITENTITTQTVNRIDRPPALLDVNAGDPLAQTFEFSDSIFLTKVDLYFQAKTASTDDIKVLIVPTANGIPTQKILAERRLVTGAVNISEDASAVTSFVFDRPCYLEKNIEYAFIVKSDSPDYVVHIAEVGKEDPVNGWVNKQSFAGVLLTSANMSTWTPRQNTDLKFQMHRASFGTDVQEIVFDTINFASPRSRFELNASFAEPTEDTLVSWLYSVDNANWVEFLPPTEIDLEAITNVLYVKAILKGTDRISPILHDSSALAAHSYDTVGSYVARQFETIDQDVRYVDVYMDEHVPAGCGIQYQVRLDEAGGWLDMTHEVADDRPFDVDNEWVERHYSYDTGSDLVLKQKVHIRCNMTSPDAATTPKIRRYRAIGRTI